MFDMRKLWREPLVHFLVIGAGLFLAFGLTRDERDDATNRIVVDAAQVEQLAAQFRRTWLRPPTEQELAGLIESHVRDEVYYREALVMGLDQNDPQVRRRMRLKLEFLLEDLSAEEPPDDETLHAYLQRHPQLATDTMTMLVRQLQPTSQGLPLEIYVFTATTEWEAYEGIQADVFSHLLAIIGGFGLRVHQTPPGADVTSIARSR